MTNFSKLATSSPYVQSVQPSVDLVNEATYSIRICYQDAASNLEACTSPHGVCNVTFDSATLAPVIVSPAENSSIAVNFDLNFTLLEDMSEGTCKLIVTQTGGLLDPVPNARRLTFSNVHEAGSYSFKMSNTYFQNGASFFSNVETPFGLNDGTFYKFEIECQDIVLNSYATGQNFGVGYAGVETLAPILLVPPVDGCLAAGSQISFQLVERAFQVQSNYESRQLQLALV